MSKKRASSSRKKTAENQPQVLNIEGITIKPPLTTQNIEELLKPDEGEDKAAFNFRRDYSLKATEVLGASVTPTNIIELGRFKWYNLYYGTSYSDEIEKLLDQVDKS